MEHDPRCEGADDAKLLADIKEYGWHVLKILDTEETPGWAYSVGLYKNYNHPEVIVFGLDVDVMHSIINTIGSDIRDGKALVTDVLYRDVIEDYPCEFKSVDRVWYLDFLGYANWFYEGEGYPAVQCFWPDKNGRFPWDSEFNPNLLWAQPLLFHAQVDRARTANLLKSIGE